MTELLAREKIMSTSGKFQFARKLPHDKTSYARMQNSYQRNLVRDKIKQVEFS